jgi:cytochrome c biogenesis protein CcmG/thiol:disulfide interchange protein DsbE
MGRMTKRLCIFVFSLLCAAQAEPLKLDALKVGSTTYSQVTVIGANTTDLYFKHAQGFANVKLKYLDTAMQKRFGYDAKAADQAERRQNEEEILYQTNLRGSLAPVPHQSAAKARGSLGTETGLADPISDKSLLGKTAPELSIDKWVGDKPSLEGKFILLNFWASWSAPSRQYIPELNALQKKYGDKLTVIGVTSEPEKDVTEMSEPRMEYASGIDSKAKLTAAAGVTTVPSILLCDPKGVVLYQGHPGALTEKKLQAVLSRSSE